MLLFSRLSAARIMLKAPCTRHGTCSLTEKRFTPAWKAPGPISVVPDTHVNRESKKERGAISAIFTFVET